MTALVTLLQAVQNDARADIDAFLAALKQESANKRLDELSAIYHFKTFWDAGAFEGNRVMLAQDLAQLMYDTTSTASLGKLLRRYDLDLLALGTSFHHGNRLIKTYFNLSRHTSQQSFATYQHFLMAGMKGETELARKVCAYLLAMEEQARVSDTLQDQQPRSAIDILREGWLVHDKEIDAIKQEAHAAKVIAINAQHTALSVKKAFLEDNEARMRRRQSYLPGDINARMRGLIHQFANYHCLRCHHEMTLEDGLPHSIEIDEVHPRAHGGNRTWDNIQALCKTCNLLKRDAAAGGEFMGRWDFRTPIFHAACAREKDKYDRHMRKLEHPYPLFPETGDVA